MPDRVPPHPNPLPCGERGPEQPPPRKGGGAPCRAHRLVTAALALAAAALGLGAGPEGLDRDRLPVAWRAVVAPVAVEVPPPPSARPAPPARPTPAADPRQQVLNALPTVALFAVASLVPAAVLMASAFVRISIVLALLRQALGSAQVPGNQVLMALALLLTALVMRPHAQAAYEQGIAPFADGRKEAARAWRDGTQPIKTFMIAQVVRTHHEHYLADLHDHAEPGRPRPAYCEEYPLRVVAPAFLLSELTTALFIGFAVYLPFLVIDLVVSAVLAAMGLIMLPPSLVSLPLKLVVFVLADGWMLVAGMLLRSFAA
jgi:flagellar biosynthesis protein FliP